jgi:hypothetical protein
VTHRQLIQVRTVIKSSKKFLMAAFPLLFFAIPAFAMPVLQSDFEGASSDGWALAGSVIITPATDYYPFGFTGSFPQGQFAAFFGGGDAAATGSMAQTISTTANTVHTLSFDYGSISRFTAGQRIEITVSDAATSQTLLATTVSDETSSSNFAAALDSYIFQFKPIGSMTQIKFQDASANSMAADGVLDNIAISSVPEPSALLLLLTGLPVLLCKARCRAA